MPDALDRGVLHRAEQIGRVHGREPAVAAAERRAHGFDDDDVVVGEFGHECAPRFVVVRGTGAPIVAVTPRSRRRRCKDVHRATNRRARFGDAARACCAACGSSSGKRRRRTTSTTPTTTSSPRATTTDLDVAVHDDVAAVPAGADADDAGHEPVAVDRRSLLTDGARTQRRLRRPRRRSTSRASTGSRPATRSRTARRRSRRTRRARRSRSPAPRSSSCGFEPGVRLRLRNRRSRRTPARSASPATGANARDRGRRDRRLRGGADVGHRPRPRSGRSRVAGDRRRPQRAARRSTVRLTRRSAAVEDDLAERRVGREEVVGVVAPGRAGAIASTTGATVPAASSGTTSRANAAVARPSPACRAAAASCPSIVSRFAMTASIGSVAARARDRADEHDAALQRGRVDVGLDVVAADEIERHVDAARPVASTMRPRQRVGVERCRRSIAAGRCPTSRPSTRQRSSFVGGARGARRRCAPSALASCSAAVPTPRADRVDEHPLAGAHVRLRRPARRAR